MIRPERDPEAVRRHIERALSHDLEGMTWADVRRMVAAGEVRLLDIHGQAAAALQILPWRGGRALHVASLGGDGMRGWLGELLALLYGIAQSEGCQAVTLWGRPGWQRLLPGWKVEQVQMSFEV